MLWFSPSPLYRRIELSMPSESFLTASSSNARTSNANSTASLSGCFSISWKTRPIVVPASAVDFLRGSSAHFYGNDRAGGSQDRNLEGQVYKNVIADELGHQGDIYTIDAETFKATYRQVSMQKPLRSCHSFVLLSGHFQTSADT